MTGYSVIGLDNPKNPLNVGGVLRAAGCYGTSVVVVAGKRPQRYMKMPTDTGKAYRFIPTILCDDVFDALPYDCVPVAVDIVKGAKELSIYRHPERAMYIFGAEDSTLDERITGKCRDVVYIPTKFCMNLAAAVNVVLYDRASKQ